MITLTKNSWYDKLYQFMFGKERTENFCDLFWSLILSILSLPFTFIPCIILLLVKRNVSFGLKFSIGTWLYVILFWINFFTWRGFIIMISSVFASIMLIAIYLYIKEKMSHNVKEKISDTIQIPIEGWKAFKGKYCPKIVWK